MNARHCTSSKLLTAILCDEVCSSTPHPHFLFKKLEKSLTSLLFLTDTLVSFLITVFAVTVNEK